MNRIEANELLAKMQAMAAAAQSGGASSVINNTAGDKVQFGNLLQDALQGVNNQQIQADKMATAYQMGDSNVSLAEVMIAGQKANIGFQAVTQVRNHLVNAYQDIMNMSI